MSGDLIHLLWRCPKLHRFWRGVVDTLNSVFQVAVPLEPIYCLLGVLEGVVTEELTRMALNRALFQARRAILLNWKLEEPPTLKSWVMHMGRMLVMEKYVYQHRGNAGKFDRLWDAWLATPGLSPMELVQGRLLGGT